MSEVDYATRAQAWKDELIKLSNENIRLRKELEELRVQLTESYQKYILSQFGNG